MTARPDRKSPWRKLTRRDFVAMLGAAAAALAAPGGAGLAEGLASDELAQARARRRRAGRRKTIWIGHC
jgi:F0F1-type ATP synthase membrane subunit c/vacuolar-type H+-ATPase subunit K